MNKISQRGVSEARDFSYLPFEQREKKFRLFFLIFSLIFVSGGLLSFCWGHFEASPIVLARALWEGGDPILQTIAKIRLTRTLLAASVGATLALSGAIFQALLRNPLAEPYTLGVSTGAAFGATLALFLGIVSNIAIPLFALGGAGFTLFWVIFLSRTEEGAFRPATLILAGLVVSSFLAAGISLLKSLADETVSSIVFWLLGSFSGRGPGHFLFFWPYALPLFVLAWLFHKELDLLSLGDEEALELGVPVSRVRGFLTLSACLAAAVCVAVSGVIGFVGLIVPHLVRLLCGANHRQLLPLSALLGASLLLFSDILARNILPTGEELPIGVVTALLGAPFFAWLLKRKKREIEWLP